MTPAWKIRRELKRLQQQLASIPQWFWEPPALRRHDAWFDQDALIQNGQQPQQDRVAIVLLYQPNGLSQSTIDLFAHLTARGYAVLAVSNCPVPAQDWPLLRQSTWKALERPNYGHDFGGYRDGIKVLWRLDITPERLVIVNDSIFYPLSDSDQTLENLEALECDIGGIMMRMRDNFQFLESYFFSISKIAFSHQAFRSFWRDYSVTSNKYKVIRRGERGFSVAMLAAGLSVRSLYKRGKFAQCLNGLSDAEIIQFLSHRALIYPELDAKCDDILARTHQENWRTLVQNFIYEALLHGEFYSSFPVASAKFLGYPVVKKSRDPAADLWRKAYVSAVLNGVIDQPSTAAWSEIYNIVHPVGPPETLPHEHHEN